MVKSVNYSKEYWDYKESVHCAIVMLEVSTALRGKFNVTLMVLRLEVEGVTCSSIKFFL